MEKLLKYDKGHFRVESGFSGFYAGVTGRKINSIDYNGTYSEIRTAEKQILSGITGIESRNIVMLDQVHGSMIIHVLNHPSSDLLSAGEADGLITAIKGVALVIRTADCVPLFLYDPEKSVLGAVHSGWKGASFNITAKCVKEMVFLYGSEPADIRAFILPSIGPESYEVNEDVACHFPENTISVNGKLHVDLWGSVENSLKKEGVRAENIFNPRICNRIDHENFFSHRFGDAGRNLNFAFMKY
ncbi:MAG: peptidoglycan editing factor PgeF [Spirochaetae bacterium HGW-Spirochaetae-5]|nr:MAG: peptidoglycan editing factor PgeF [Spirochaetae bacterium HGW-Spirochaetae-5]